MKGIVVRTRQANTIPYELAVGQVTKVVDAATRQVKVIQMELNDYLKMYFNKSHTFNSTDNEKSTKKGDIVLLRRLDTLTKTDASAFKIEKVLFKIDNLVDPITGKSVDHDHVEIKKHLDSLLTKN